MRPVGLQQQPQHAEEALHQHVDALTATGQQQLLHRLHRNAHVPAERPALEPVVVLLLLLVFWRCAHP